MQIAQLPRVTVLICALNEAENLPHVLPRIPDWVSEVVLVDGHSTDGTVEVAKTLRPDVRLVAQPGEGKGDALKCGVAQSAGDIIVTVDADGETDPAEMDRFVAPLLQGYDFAKGTRFRDGLSSHRPKHRILGNWIITLVFDLLFFRRYTDLCSGYNAFWKEKAAGLLDRSANGFENEPLFNARAVKEGLKVIEVPHRDGRRLSGAVKEQSWRQGFGAIKTIIRERFGG